MKNDRASAEIITQESGYSCQIIAGMDINFTVAFNSLYRGPGKPYSVDIEMSGEVKLFFFIVKK